MHLITGLHWPFGTFADIAPAFSDIDAATPRSEDVEMIGFLALM